MKHESVNDVFDRAQEYHKAGDLTSAHRLYTQLLNADHTNPNVLFQIGTLHLHAGDYGVATHLLMAAVEGKPDFGPSWNHLAIALKYMHKDAAADRAYEEAEKYIHEAYLPSNRAGIYINNGAPEKALEHAERALRIDPDFPMARWHKALALMEMQKWESAWDWHESRLIDGSGCNVAKRNYQKEGMTPWWDGRAKGLVVVHGEQGLGDEIMFASCLPDAIATGAEIVWECNPRLEGLFKRSFGCRVVGTHAAHGEDWIDDRRVDFKCAVGTLPKFYRRSDSAFPGTQYLVPDEKRRKRWRKKLKALGRRKKIGITWQGGVGKTAVHVRSLRLTQMVPILNQNADFISLQYTKHAQEELDQFRRETGIKVHHWKDGAEGEDMDDQASLIAELDLVISVCQTAIHVAGAIGKECWVLTPSRPSWRYGVTGDMPWYNSVHLLRQQDDSWESLIQDSAAKLKDWL